MKNLTPVRDSQYVYVMAIENMLSIGLIIRQENNIYYFDDNFNDFIEQSKGNLLKRKIVDEIIESSKKPRQIYNLVDEDQPGSSSDEVCFFINFLN